MADIMRRIEERLEVFRKSDFAGCGELLRKTLKYAIGEWPAMKRVLECGDVELSNNLSEQMMRRIKDKDEPEERREHRKREVGQAQRVHVHDNRELQDGEA